MKTILAPSVFALAACCSAPAFATYAPSATRDLKPVVEVNDGLTLGVNEMFQHYNEHNATGYSYDSENGFVRGFHIRASGMANLYRAAYLYAGIEGDIRNGTTRYSGHYMGTNTKAHATTHNHIDDYRVRLGLGFLASDSVMLTPYVSFGQRYWNRAIVGNPSAEHYQHSVAGAGLKLDIQAFRHFVVSTDVELEKTLNPSMHVLINGANTTFKLQKESALQASLGVSYLLGKHSALYATLGYSQFSYGKSPVNAAGYLEPTSDTQDISLGIGTRFEF